ncbi:MAG TPA: tetratricopeptide repeat protein [Gemmataceae bacterium]|nr:tetratricopeptide repeat protein [Gemmataceae bacterium]
MFSGTTGLRWGLAVAALVLMGLAGPVRAADDDKALRDKVLALNQVTGEDTISDQIDALAEDKAGTAKLLGVGVKMAQEKNTPLNYNAAYILAGTALELKDLEATVTLYRVCIDKSKKIMSPTKLFLCYSGILTAYESAGKYDEAIKVCKEFQEIPEEKFKLDPLNPDLETPKYNATLRRGKELMRRELIPLSVRQGKVDEANKEVEKMLKADPDDRDALELRALIQRESGDYAAAAKTFEDIIQRTNDDIEKIKKNTEASKEVKDAFIKQLRREERKLRYSLSGVHIDAKDVKKAAEQLKLLVKEDPDNASYNNDLGYVWADNDMNLDEAEKLIRKAIVDDKKKQAEKKPGAKPEEIKANAAYLDSLGWVLYKQKKYKDALQPLQEAVQAKEGQSIEIYDHLAEVHMALGEMGAALGAWKKGVEKAGPSKREQERKVEVEKKIKTNQEKK